MCLKLSLSFLEWLKYFEVPVRPVGKGYSLYEIPEISRSRMLK